MEVCLGKKASFPSAPQFYGEPLCSTAHITDHPRLKLKACKVETKAKTGQLSPFSFVSAYCVVRHLAGPCDSKILPPFTL